MASTARRIGAVFADDGDLPVWFRNHPAMKRRIGPRPGKMGAARFNYFDVGFGGPVPGWHDG